MRFVPLRRQGGPRRAGRVVYRERNPGDVGGIRDEKKSGRDDGRDIREGWVTCKGWRDEGCITCKGWKTRDANVNFFFATDQAISNLIDFNETLFSDASTHNGAHATPFTCPPTQRTST